MNFPVFLFFKGLFILINNQFFGQIMLLFCSLFLLFIFLLEEKKGVWYNLIFSRLQTSFLITFFCCFLLLLLLFFYNRFFFFPLLFLGLAFPYVHKHPHQDDWNSFCFFNFACLFVYKNIFYISIFLVTAAQIGGISAEFLLNLLVGGDQTEDGTIKMMFGLVKNSVKEVEHAKGAKKIDSLYKLSKDFHKAYYEFLHIKPFSAFNNVITELKNKDISLNEGTIIKSGIQIKLAHDFAKTYKQKTIYSEENQLLVLGWNQQKEEITKRFFPPVIIREITLSTKEALSVFEGYNVQNEIVISKFIKEVGAQNNDEISRFKAEILKQYFNWYFFTNNAISAPEQLQINVIDDRKTSMRIGITGGTYFEDKKGVIESQGAENRALLIAKNRNEILQRPLIGTYDYAGIWGGLSGKFEIKGMFSNLLSEDPKFKEATIAVVESSGRAINYCETYFTKHTKSSLSFSKEAFISIDVTQTLWLTQHHWDNASLITIDLMHKSFQKWVYENKISQAQGKPIIYFGLTPEKKGIIVIKNL